MELCEDLIERIKLYGISQYLDEKTLIKKLQDNWKVNANEDKSVEKRMVQANTYFSSSMAYIMRTAGDFMFKFGVVGAAQSSVSRWALGYAMIHPGYFMTALVSSAVVKIGAENL